MKVRCATWVNCEEKKVRLQLHCIVSSFVLFRFCVRFCVQPSSLPVLRSRKKATLSSSRFQDFHLFRSLKNHLLGPFFESSDVFHLFLPPLPLSPPPHLFPFVTRNSSLLSFDFIHWCFPEFCAHFPKTMEFLFHFPYPPPLPSTGVRELVELHCMLLDSGQAGTLYVPHAIPGVTELIPWLITVIKCDNLVYLRRE